MKEDSIAMQVVVKIKTDKYTDGEEINLKLIKQFLESKNYRVECYLPYLTINSNPTLIIEEIA